MHVPKHWFIRYTMLFVFKRTVDPAREKAVAVSIPRFLFIAQIHFKVITYVLMLIELVGPTENKGTM